MTSERMLRVTMPDGSQWDVPVRLVVANRLAYYKRRAAMDDDDLNPNDYEIRDWSSANMNWSDVSAYAVKVKDRPALTAADFQEGWVNGERTIVEPTK